MIPPHHASAVAPRRRAFTLIELLFAVILMTIVGLVAAQAFGLTMRLSRETTAAQDDLARMERLVDALQRDVWSARQIDVRAENGLHLIGGDGVVWEMRDDVLTRQAADDPPQRWPEAVGSVSFERQGPTVVAMFSDATGRQVTHRFVSQVLLAQEDPR